MICMEEVGAMVKEIWKKVIWPVMAVLFLAVVFRPLCIAEGGIDYWKLLFLMGIPFGAQKMGYSVLLSSSVNASAVRRIPIAIS